MTDVVEGTLTQRATTPTMLWKKMKMSGMKTSIAGVLGVAVGVFEDNRLSNGQVDLGEVME